MYITRVELKHVRRFENLVIDFDELGSSALIVGDNGDGKSTLLRSIAMGLCDESSAAALLRDLPGDFVSHNRTRATIKIWLARSRNLSYLIKTTIRSLKAFERVEQEVFKISKGKKPVLLTQNNFPWERIFVSAYGAGTRTIGTADFSYYVPVDAVYSLFKYEEPLQNPELAVRRLIETARESGKKGPKERQRAADKQLSQIKNLLATLLNLDQADDIDLTSTGIKVKRLGEWAELGAVGDGYKATITWILDLISWWFLYNNGNNKWQIRPDGIIIIDEVEQHLHPIWQIGIMSLIRQVFPKLQIISSTHSPLVISGSRDLPIHRLYRGEHKVFNASGWLAEDVYREVMGLPSSRPQPEREDIDEYHRLYLRVLKGIATASDKAKMNRLQKSFAGLPETDPVILTSKLNSLDDFIANIK